MLPILVGSEALGVWGCIALLSAVFFVASAGIGGTIGPIVFGQLLGTKASGVMIGFLIAAVSEAVFGVEARFCGPGRFGPGQARRAAAVLRRLSTAIPADAPRA